LCLSIDGGAEGAAVTALKSKSITLGGVVK
jgi:hypothetical protein